MQKSKKRIYGALGLATVAGMTVVASGIPAPEAYAESSSDVEINVVVFSDLLDVEISGPVQDGGATSKDSVTLPIIITDAEKLQYQVTARQDGVGGTPTVASNTIILDSTGGYTGTYDLPLTLSDYRDYLIANEGFSAYQKMYFTLKVTAIGTGGGIAEDTITFEYGKVTIDPGDNINPEAPEDETNVPTDEEGNPEIKIETDEETETVRVEVKDETTGEVIWEGEVTPEPDGTIDIPFVDNDIPSGNYEIVVNAYDKEGNKIGSSSINIRYVQKDAPGLPNTGGVSIAGLNIAQGDFLISSALAFCLVSLGGIYLLHRKSKSARK